MRIRKINILREAATLVGEPNKLLKEESLTSTVDPEKSQGATTPLSMKVSQREPSSSHRDQRRLKVETMSLSSARSMTSISGPAGMASRRTCASPGAATSLSAPENLREILILIKNLPQNLLLNSREKPMT